MPPPLPLQADSLRMVPDELTLSVVPPTARTFGELAGLEMVPSVAAVAR